VSGPHRAGAAPGAGPRRGGTRATRRTWTQGTWPRPPQAWVTRPTRTGAGHMYASHRSAGATGAWRMAHRTHTRRTRTSGAHAHGTPAPGTPERGAGGRSTRTAGRHRVAGPARTGGTSPRRGSHRDAGGAPGAARDGAVLRAGRHRQTAVATRIRSTARLLVSRRYFRMPTTLGRPGGPLQDLPPRRSATATPASSSGNTRAELAAVARGRVSTEPRVHLSDTTSDPRRGTAVRTMPR
jgi:hypothetical protein